MDRLPSYWPSEEDQVVLAQFFEHYPTLAYGMCYLFGARRQAGMSCLQAAREVYRLVEIQQADGACGGRNA
jgi:hypothetical protein